MRNRNGNKTTVKSIEPNIADLANGWLKSYKPDYKLEQESLNTEIDTVLNDIFLKMVVWVEIDLIANLCFRIKP